MANNQDSTLYQDERISIPLIVLFLLLESFVALSAYVNGLGAGSLLVGLVILVLYSLIFSLNIFVTSDYLIFSYGFGLIQTVNQRNALENHKVEPNSKLITWVYDPFSADVVSVAVRGAGKIYIPTANASKLLAALRSR